MKNILLVLASVLILNSGFYQPQLSTSMRITVIDNLGNFVEGAEVTIYKTEEDYRNGTNPVGEKQITDKKGRARFKDIPAVSYYIHAVKGDKTNIGEGVQTAPLTKGRLNKLNTVIE